MKVLLTALLALVFCCPSAGAAELTPELFAYGSRLPVDGQQPFYQLELPLELYRGITRNDLGDLRVFNAAGQVVPHALRPPETSRIRQDAWTKELPFFPLHADAKLLNDDLVIHVERNAQGSIIEVRENQPQDSDSKEAVYAYLLDAGEPKHPMDVLELTWAEQQANFLGELRVETSADLIHWHPLTSAAVAVLNYQGYQLERSRIQLPHSQERYLRLSRPEQPLPEIRQISALFQQSYSNSLPKRHWLELEMRPMTDQPQTFRGDLEGLPPIDRIQIQLTENNSMATARLAAGNGNETGKRDLWRGLLYHLRVDGQTISNPLISIPPTPCRYWALTIDSSETSLQMPPTLKVGWQPARLIFLARGEGPFLLAYGSGQIEPSQFSLKELLQKTAADTDRAINNIQPGPQFSLGGEGCLQSPSHFSWKTWLLWSVLVAGVLLIGWLSLRLYRQLQTAENSSRN